MNLKASAGCSLRVVEGKSRHRAVFSSLLKGTFGGSHALGGNHSKWLSGGSSLFSQLQMAEPSRVNKATRTIPGYQ